MALSKVVPKETEAQQPKLQIIRNGTPSDSLDIANFEDGSLSPSKTIGIVKNGKKYLYETDKDKIFEVIKKWKDTGVTKNAEEAFAKLEKDRPLKEFPKNYPDKYFVSESGLIFKVETLDISKSKDKFVVQYEDKTLAGKGTIQVTLEVKNPKNPNSPYKEKVKITLTEDKNNPGTFRSQDLVLVSAKYMDEYRVNGQKDNSQKDQTFLAELGSEVSVSYQNKTSGEIDTNSASVQIKGVTEIPIYVFKDKNGVPFATQEQINRHVANAQETWASAGVKFLPKEPIYLDAPAGVELSDGLDKREAELCLHEIVKKYPDNPGIRFVFAGDNFPGAEKVGAFAVTEDYRDIYAKQYKLYNSIFLKSESELSERTGHEMGHCYLYNADNKLDLKKDPNGNLIYNGGHTKHPSNLMAEYGAKDTNHITVFGRRHVSDDQIQLIFEKSTLIKDPKNYPDLAATPQKNTQNETLSEPKVRSIFDEPCKVQAPHREGWRMVPQP